jgi:hypothetical protein
MATNPPSNNANEPDTRASLGETLGGLEKILRFVEKRKGKYSPYAAKSLY